MFLFPQSGSALFVSARKTNKTKRNVAALTRTGERWGGSEDQHADEAFESDAGAPRYRDTADNV